MLAWNGSRIFCLVERWQSPKAQELQRASLEAIDDAVLGRQPQEPPSSLGVQGRNKES